jgi:hypothetical protein
VKNTAALENIRRLRAAHTPPANDPQNTVACLTARPLELLRKIASAPPPNHQSVNKIPENAATANDTIGAGSLIKKSVTDLQIHCIPLTTLVLGAHVLNFSSHGIKTNIVEAHPLVLDEIVREVDGYLRQAWNNHPPPLLFWEPASAHV